MSGAKLVTPEQMELARLRAELPKTKMELDTVKKPQGTSGSSPCEVGLHRCCVNSWRSSPVATTSIASDERLINSGRIGDGTLLAHIKAIHA